MRLTPTVAAAATTVASRSEVSKPAAELKSTAPEVKSTPAGLKSMVDLKPVHGKPENWCGTGIVSGGCFPPFPPFPGVGDANGRAQGRQLHEIAEGVRNGSITAQEAERLLAQQEAISKATEQAMADGKLTQGEKLKLQLQQAQAAYNIYQAGNNSQRDAGARWSTTAQTQANQIDQIANGRRNGNITASEASGLLDQQERIADVRGGNSWFGDILAGFMQWQAGDDIRWKSLPGDQTKWGWDNVFPLPRPVTPLQRRPELELDVSMLRKGVIGG
jgi:hypothetical protein